MNLLAEPATRAYLDEKLSARNLTVPSGDMAWVALRDLELEDYLGHESFDDIRDETGRVFDDAYVTVAAPGWQPVGRASVLAAAVPPSRVPMFTRRVRLGWADLLILDDASPERRLLATTWLNKLDDYPDAGELPVLSIGFVGNSARTLSLIRTHCSTKHGCTSKLKGCRCSMVEVVTGDGDDAWACLCDQHGSA